MAAMTIDLSEQDISLARRRASELQIGVEVYLQRVITEHLQDTPADVDEDYGAPDHLNVTSMGQIESLVREGLASPSTVLTEADMEQMRRDLIARHANSQVR